MEYVWNGSTYIKCGNTKWNTYGMAALTLSVVIQNGIRMEWQHLRTLSVVIQNGIRMEWQHLRTLSVVIQNGIRMEWQHLRTLSVVVHIIVGTAMKYMAIKKFAH